jgi:hypothetical protein
MSREYRMRKEDGGTASFMEDRRNSALASMSIMW